MMDWFMIGLGVTITLCVGLRIGTWLLFRPPSRKWRRITLGPAHTVRAQAAGFDRLYDDLTSSQRPW